MLSSLTLPLASMASELPSLNALQQSLESGESQEVYQQLQPREGEFAGQAGYDLLFAQAAMAQQQPHEAIWALERLLLVQPNNHQGRVLLAEAFIEIQGYERAENQLKRLERNATSEAVLQQVNQLRARLTRLTAPKRFTLTTRVIAALGHDSNVSSSPSTSIDQGGNTLTFTEEPSLFSELAAHQNLRFQASDRLSLSAGYRLEDSRPFEEADYIRQKLGFNLGGTYTASHWEASLKPGWNRGWRDGAGEVQEGLLSLNGRFSLSTSNHLLAFSNLSSLSYDETPDNDGNFYLLGGGWITQVGNSSAPMTLVFTGHYLGSEQPDANSGNLAAPGINSSVAFNFTDHLQVKGKAGWSNRTYSGDRSDENLFSLGFGAIYKPTSRWVLEPNLNYNLLTSSNEVAEYNRLTVKMSVRYEFQPYRF
ncbi:outer membrane beta-barrel protein [Marinospirillum perlucidum]|uniref:outer membrane beta-barrel protein n=1 Tax=Marinospirillum perlucidum TaxID=1982602 RepID=UPI0013901EE8|nr:outer membrane beta-barrel protein [Marinospirillum perlucidum]